MMTAESEMKRLVYLTRGVRVGIISTLATTCTLVFLVFFARQFYSVLVLGNVIAFQLSFMWTCAELLDGPSDEPPNEEPREGDYTH